MRVTENASGKSVYSGTEYAFVSLNRVNQLAFVMVKCGVFFAVRTEFLNIIQPSFGFKGIVMWWTVSETCISLT
jgi:hypothetical protein